MTRARAKRMKEALQGLVMEIQEEEAALANFKASPRLITYLHIKDNGQGLTHEVTM